METKVGQLPWGWGGGYIFSTWRPTQKISSISWFVSRPIPMRIFSAFFFTNIVHKYYNITAKMWSIYTEARGTSNFQVKWFTEKNKVDRRITYHIPMTLPRETFTHYYRNFQGTIIWQMFDGELRSQLPIGVTWVKSLTGNTVPPGVGG